MAEIEPKTTRLEFHQAMSDFKTMFPTMDDDVIEAVLRANQGTVDSTIDQLLSMSTDNENEKIRNEIEIKPPDIVEGAVGGNSQNGPLRLIKGWDSVLLVPLPDDFLRIPLDRYQLQKESELEDERIAIMLQNEEFMSELRWNKDFLSTLSREGTHEDRINERYSEDDALFRERLRNMGKVSKKKFSQLAKMFKKRSSGSSSNSEVRENLLMRKHCDTDSY